MLDTLMIKNVGVVVLAAGRGSRLNSVDTPKVMLELNGKPMVHYTIETLKEVGFNAEQICLVVGFHKEKVIEYFNDSVSFAVQAEQLGTAHAAFTGMKSLPQNIEHVLVMGGDDSAFYKAETLEKLITTHVNNRNVLTLLTAEPEIPGNIGRVIRQADGRVEIVEKEHMTEEQKKLKEISTGTFVFDRTWFEEMYPTMPPIPKLNEFGLPTALKIARESGKKHEVVKLIDSTEWFGVNTPEELEEARRRKINVQ
jgi:UDP-N-acetylglucosamine pyrophosphorylase